MSYDGTGVVAVLITVETEGDAAAMASTLVEARLAACVQQLPIQSVYRWKGAVEKGREVLLVAKTQQARVKELITFVRVRHAYETPEIIVLPVQDGWPPYLEWVATETS